MTGDGRRAVGRAGRALGDRGVSETLGFVFAFALVTASVGVVYTTGIGGLQNAQEDEQVTNAVRAFDVLADNVRDVTEKGAPSRATELKLADGTLRFDDPIEVTVQVNDTDPDSDANATYGMSTRPLVYDAPGGEVVYSAGATFRVDDGVAAMRAEPGIVVGDSDPNVQNTSVVPLVLTYPRGSSGGIGGSSTVLVVAHSQSTGLEGRFDTGEGSVARVNVTVESPRAAAWGRYFEAKGMSAVDGDAADGSVTYQFYTDRLLAPKPIVEFDLKR